MSGLWRQASTDAAELQRLRSEVEQLRESNSRWQERCLTAQRERDVLRDDRLRGVQKARADAAEAVLTKVRALALSPDAHYGRRGDPDGYCVRVNDLLAVLDGPKPVQVEPYPEEEERS